jgi:tRNA(Ile)-lysidine synthase
VPAASLDPKRLFQSFEGLAHLALAVSGGSDSMALLRLAHLWREGHDHAPRLTVLTVDHGLRTASADEAGVVARWSQALGLPHVTLKWAGSKPSSAIQAAARHARYDLMADWCASHGCNALATAHTMDDQAETVLMRLARTASFDSLAGIPAFGRWGSLPVIRPLLDQRRRDLRALLVELGQAWIEDESNDDPRFERVRIRHALPSLAEIGITTEALARLARTCSEAVAAQEARTSQWLEVHLAEYPEGYSSLAMEDFLAQPLAIQIRALGRLVPRYGGQRPVERHELERLARALATGGRRRTLGGALVGARRERIWFGREAARVSREPVVVGSKGEALWDGRFVVRAPPGSRIISAQAAGYEGGARDLPMPYRNAEPTVILPGGQVHKVSFGFGQKSAIQALFRPLTTR